MSEQIVDDFYTARNLLYIGAYPQCLSNLSTLTRISADASVEKDSLQYRAYLGQGNYALILDEIPATAQSPVLLAIRHLTLFRQAQLKGDQAAQESAVSAVTELIAAPSNLVSSTFTAIAAQLLANAQKHDDALRILAMHPKSLECIAVTVTVYLAESRVDLAQKLVARVRTWAEDAPIAQLAEAWTDLYVGGAKYNEAYYIFEELAQAASVSTVRLLNALAVTKMHLAQYPEAEGLLQEALEKDANDSDTLANLIVCANLTGKGLDVKSRYLSQLTHAAPNHQFVRDLEAKEAEFDAISAKLSR
ncbi:coatomer subunit epsilon-like protein [Martensiomyces pterosporus]|nr:coatomer subunit epsilon-like protein [Martensiomyces pterosporus]